MLPFWRFWFVDEGGELTWPDFEPCSIQQLDVGFTHNALHLLEIALRLLAQRCRTLGISLDAAGPLAFAELDTLLHSYIEQASFFALHILSKIPSLDWRRVRLPQRAGCLYFTWVDRRQDGSQSVTTELAIGQWAKVRVCLRKSYDVFGSQPGAEFPKRLWARRDADWQAQDVVTLEKFVEMRGAKLVWE